MRCGCSAALRAALHGLFGVGGIEKEVLGVDIQPFIICIVQRVQKGIGLHALHQPLCGRMAAGSGCASGLHRTAPERDILCGVDFGQHRIIPLRPSPDIFRRSIGSESLTCTKHARTFRTLPRQKISRRLLLRNDAGQPEYLPVDTILYFILSLRRGKGNPLFLREMPPRRESTIDRESVQTV